VALVFSVWTLAACAASPVPANGVISSPGEYYLDTNRSSNGANYVVQINANNVTLDLNGKIVQCTPPSPSTQSTFGIIAANRSNVTIRNGWTLGCRQAISVAGSVNLTIEAVRMHARHIGVYGNDSTTGLIVRGSEIYDISGAPSEVYAIGINRPGGNCLIERTVFRNLHRQAGVPPEAIGEGVGVIFSPGSTGCVARQNWHENSKLGHLEIGYWVGNSTVVIEETTITNVGRAIAASPGYNLTATDNRFWMREEQTGSYAIGAQQGLASDNLIIGYDDPILGNIPVSNNLILR
jgi:hypothetical protein